MNTRKEKVKKGAANEWVAREGKAEAEKSARKREREKGQILIKTRLLLFENT